MTTTTAPRINVTAQHHLDRALRHVAAVVNEQSSWRDTLFTISNATTEVDGGGKRRALRSWASVGDKLSTLQVTLDMSTPDNPKVKGAWSPGVRTIAKEGPSYLVWDTGSSFELKGTQALTSSDDIWVGGYEFGTNTLVLVIFRRESGQ